MGLEKKEWNFEHPAEQNMDAHDAYRDEGMGDSKPWLWVLALVCSSLSVYAMYYMESHVYGGVVDTNWAAWLGAMIGTPVGLWIAKATGREEENRKQDKKQKKIVSGIVAALLVFYLLLCWSRPDKWVLCIQILVLVFVGFGVEKVTKKKLDKYPFNAWSFLLLYVLVALMAFAAPQLLGMTSVAEGEKLLRTAGYQGVYFETRTMPHWMGEEMAEEAYGKMRTIAEDEFVYLYGGAKDDKSYGILVDPYGRGILAEQEKLPGTVVYDWLD